MKTNSHTIVLTGCTRGCGRALLDRFVEAGHRVIGCGRSEALIEELRDTFGETCTFATLDVTDDASVAEWAKKSIAEFGAPDFLINNAAVMNRTAPLWEISTDEFDHVIDVNIKGVANVIRHFVPAMVERGTGVIVNFSSGWGRSTSPEVAPYCATKYAMEGLSKALAEELPRGMVSVPLNPGVINTEMLQSCWADSAHRCPSPEDWSHAASEMILNLGPRDNGRSVSVG